MLSVLCYWRGETPTRASSAQLPPNFGVGLQAPTDAALAQVQIRRACISTHPRAPLRACQSQESAEVEAENVQKKSWDPEIHAETSLLSAATADGRVFWKRLWGENDVQEAIGVQRLCRLSPLGRNPAASTLFFPPELPIQ